KSVGMRYVTKRWPGGMLTNFPTIRKAVKKMISIDKLAKDPSWDNLSKREKLQIGRQRAKLEKILGRIADLSRMPAGLFIVDVMNEKIAVSEAHRLGIQVFAIVDTNSNPEGIDLVIPANDDASQSSKLIVCAMVVAVREGLNERKAEKKDDDEAPKKKARRKIKKEKTPEPVPADDEVSDDDEDISDNEDDAGDEEE